MTSIRILDLTDRTVDAESPMFVHLLAESNGAVHGRIGVGVLADGHWALHLPDASIPVEEATLLRLISSAVQFVKDNHRCAVGSKSTSVWLQCLLMPDDSRSSVLEASGLADLTAISAFESTMDTLCSSLRDMWRPGRTRPEIRQLTPVECALDATETRLLPLIDHVLNTTDGVQCLPRLSPRECLKGWIHRTSTAVYVAESRGGAGGPEGVLVVGVESPTGDEVGREIIFIGVRSDKRRCGVASALISDALCDAGDIRSGGRVSVTCAEVNPTALAFYRRLGFIVVQRLRLFGSEIAME